MWVPLFFFLASLTVKQDQTPLRAACAAESETLVSLPAGTPVDVRFVLSDGSDCYKVSAKIDGKALTGYVPGAALSGADRFQEERASARPVDDVRELAPVETRTKQAMVRGGDSAMSRVSQLLDANKPAEALEILDPYVKRYPKNADILTLAGVAAFRSDQLRTALDYWSQSLDLKPNPDLARIYAKVKRESDADRSGEKLYGARVALRYEGAALPADTAREMLATLDSEYARISAELGCPAEDRIVAIVQSRDAYLRATGAAEWSGGEYDGRIHVALMEGNQVGPLTRRTLAHELVHACLTSIASANGTRFDAWVQEGLAQKLSGDTLSPAMRAAIRDLAANNQMPKLEQLGRNWSRLSTESARLAYSIALAGADQLVDRYNAYGLRNVLTNPPLLQQLTGRIDKDLQESR